MKKICVSLSLSLALLSCSDIPHFSGFSPLSEEANTVLNHIEKTYGVKVSRLKENDTRLPWYLRFTTSYTPVKNTQAIAEFNFNKSLEFAHSSEFPPPVLDGHQADSFERSFLNNHLIDEFDKYPKDFFKSQKLHDIYFVDKLKAGFLFVQFDVYGIGFNVNNEKTMIMSATDFYDTQFATSSLHHELFHVIDDDLIFGEETWNTCQPTAQDKKKFDNPNSDEYHPGAGFVSQYAKSIFREDKAEVFRLMMSGGRLSQFLDNWIEEGDSALRCKRNWLKHYLKSRFPNFDDRYFKFLTLGLRGLSLQNALIQPTEMLALEILERAYDANDFANNAPPPPIGFQVTSSKPPKDLPKMAMPAGIGELKGLKSLVLTNNQWTTLHPELSQLTQLQELKITGQHLTQFPKEILALTQLEKLSLHDDISDLPSGLSRLSHLKELNMSFLEVPDLSVLTSLPLESLSIGTRGGLDQPQTMPLSTVLKELQGLKSLSMGSLDSRQIRTPESWKTLESLTLSLPRLNAPIQGLDTLTQLKSLDLQELPQNVNTQAMYEAISQLKNLEELKLSFVYTNNQQSPDIDALLNLPKLKTLITWGAFDTVQPEVQRKLETLRARCEEKNINCQLL